MNESSSIFDQQVPPVKQAIIAYTAILVFSGLIKLMQLAGWVPSGYLAIWVISASFLMLFGMFNSINYISAVSMGVYWSRSIFSFAGLAVLSAVTAWFFTNVPIGDAATFKWLYLVLTVGYLVFLSIVGFIRIIIELAKKKDTRDFSNRRHRHGPRL